MEMEGEKKAREGPIGTFLNIGKIISSFEFGNW
jgi:hypothetical protein